jgi:hypothetical protein
LSAQKAFLVFDERLQEHPCQKHPSTNITTRLLQKTKSGLPGNPTQFMHQPDIPNAARDARSLRSVVFPFRDFTSDIIRDRALVVTLSIVC